MKILVITAMEEEKLENKDNNGIIFETIGMGQVNAATSTAYLIKKHSPELVILLGTCGSLREDLKMGDVVVGTRFINGDYDLYEYDFDFKRDIITREDDLTRKIGKLFKTGTFYCISSFKTAGQKRLLEGEVVEMESFAVVKTCEKLGVNCIVCKTVSDNLKGVSKDEFVDFLKKKYSPDSVLEKILGALGSSDEPEWRELIAEIPDFPKKGILFRDVAGLVADRKGFSACIREWSENICDLEFDYIASIESRGFIFGSAMANELGLGMVLIRKKGKLPPKTISERYALEYGTDEIEVKENSLKPGDKVLLLDDVLATGGTMKAAIKLLKKTGATVVGATCLIKLKELYREKEIEGVQVRSILDL